MYRITIQFATEQTSVPKRSLLKKWAKEALKQKTEAAEVTIRIVDVNEMTLLNSSYRHKQGPTNVLSFPVTLPEAVTVDVPLLGDIVICADVVNQEALTQGKLAAAHWAHMIVHGIFHLLGYDHETDQEASIMEALEVKTLASLGFGNPYELEETE